MPPEPNELPLPKSTPVNNGANSEAVNYVREKLSGLYPSEPDIKAETEEIKQLGDHSNHQEFIEKLLKSDASLADIQTAWHIYYQKLDDEQKHVVWKEYYESHAKLVEERKSKHNKAQGGVTKDLVLQHHKQAYYNDENELIEKNKITGKGILKNKHRFQSLFFGLGFGFLVIFIFLFGLFNERFIAPFISPSKKVSLAPLIVDPTGNNSVGPDNIVIIPKINVVAPVIYDVPSISDHDMQAALNNGVVRYPQSSNPGQTGNVVIVGHSSNNYFNDGKYKFAFVLLDQLQIGDTFMINYNSKQYVYQIYSRQIVSPSDVSVLGTADRPSTATLITCNPPGTSLRRLVLVANQISPAPSQNTAVPVQNYHLQPTVIPGNSESLWHRFVNWLSN
jgi:sortase A